MDYTNYNIIKKGIEKIVESVIEINAQGRKLVLVLRQMGLSIHDVDNDCREVLLIRGHRNTVYFTEYWSEYVESDIDEAIAQLEMLKDDSVVKNENYKITETGIKKIAQLVFEINNEGEELVLMLRNSNACIYDAGNECNQFLIFENGNHVLFDKNWNENSVADMQEAIRQLEQFRLELI